MSQIEYKYDLSVIIPVYNVESYLAACLDSIVEQESCTIEVIAVDDVSTDSSLSILKKYEKQYALNQRIDINIIVLKENSGPGYARNLAVKEAKGEYVFFADSDDLIVSGAFSKLLEIARSELSDVTIFPYSLWRDNTCEIGEMFSNDRDVLNQYMSGHKITTRSINDSQRLLVMSNYPWNKLYKTSFIKKNNIKFSIARMNEDILIHWESLILSNSITLVDEAFYIHRLFETGNQVTNCFDKTRFELFGVLSEVENFIRKDKVLMKKHYTFFLLFKLTVFRWAHSRMQEDLVKEFREKMVGSMQLFSRKDFLLGAHNMPNLYSEMLKIKLNIHPEFYC